MLKTDRTFLLTLAAVSLALTLPGLLLLAERWPINPDHILHAIVFKNISIQFWSGDWYPRWLMDANAGLGSQDAIFQPPLHNFFGVFLQWLAPFDTHGFGRLMLVTSFVLFFGGYGCYLWLREYFEQNQAQLGALIYITYPLVSLFLYDYSGFPGIDAIAVFPWMLLLAKKISEDPIKYAPYYAFSQAALIFAHLPSTLVFSGVPWLYAIVSAKSQDRLRVLSLVTLAALAGIALAAIYWAPVMINRSYMRYELYLSGAFDYRNNFIHLFYPFERFSDFDRLYTLCTTVIPFVFCLWDIRKKTPFAQHKTQVFFWLLVFAASIFMTLPASRPIWDHIAILHNLQFPKRFTIVAIPAFVFLITCWLPKLANASLFFTLSTICAIIVFESSAARWYSERMPPYQATMLNKQLIGEWSTVETVWMKNAGIRDLLNPPPRFLSVPPYQTITGVAEITNIAQTPRSFTFHAHVASPSALVALHRYYYPGWIVPDTMPQGISIAEHDALLAVNLPAGDYDVEIDQPWFPGEKLGDLLSGIALVIIGGWILFPKIKRLERHA